MLSLILLVSGYCSLVYQVVWIREFRLIFGGTTGAMAAVLAVFMGGLGLGGAILGRRVEKSASPLFFYGWVEIGISLTAALTPFLLTISKQLYFGTGGEIGMGYGLATLLRGTMTLIVIGLPCFLMGGTLPAAVKYLQHNGDRDRKITGWLYGINIVGALAGVYFTTFVLLELLGNSSTLYLAAILNLCIGIAALALCYLSKNKQKPSDEITKSIKVESDDQENPSVIPPSLAYGAAFMTGLVFFIMELVWYRMATPLTGGSVYAVGMVLMVALLGLALGGWIYGLAGKWIGHRPNVFALLAAFQAVVVLIPYLMGDSLAWYVAVGVSEGLKGGWNEMLWLWFLTIAGLALLPSIIAGIQFPLLLSILGRGGDQIGRQLGDAYAWNTAGAIAGSLLGGFLLLPLMGAKNLWVFTGALCAVLSLVFLIYHLKVSSKRGLHSWFKCIPAVTALLLVAVTISVFLVPGPSAYWRHSAIGFGRVSNLPKTASDRLELFALANYNIKQEWEGRETSVAVLESESRALINNGKSDSSVHGDSGTIIGLALIIPALTHPTGVRSATIIGAGTGVSAGWMGAFPGVERVDLLEMEPAVIEAQKWFSEGNLNAMSNPQVEVILGDARETLATKGRKYDAIISEPSNLTRSGICNFYTVEYYQQCAKRMNEDGMFVQWLQGYNLDPLSVGQVTKTMFQVFPRVELWVTQSYDFVLIGSFNEDPYNLDQVREKIKHPIYKKALARAFYTDSAEGFFTRFMADSNFLSNSDLENIPVNTDDHNTLEFRVARHSLKADQKEMSIILKNLYQRRNISNMIDGELVGELLREEWFMMQSDFDAKLRGELKDKLWELLSFSAFKQGNYEKALKVWRGDPKTMKSKLFLSMATSVCQMPFEDKITALRPIFPAETEILIGIRRFYEGKFEQGMVALTKGFKLQRDHHWAERPVMDFLLNRLLMMCPMLNRDELEQLFDLLEPPLPSGCYAIRRQTFLLHLSTYLDDDYKRRALVFYKNKVPPTATKTAVAATLPEREDCRQALEIFYQLGGQLPEKFSVKNEPGPGFYEVFKKMTTSAKKP